MRSRRCSLRSLRRSMGGRADAPGGRADAAGAWMCKQSCGQGQARIKGQARVREEVQ